MFGPLALTAGCRDNAGMCGRLVISEPDLSVFVEPFEVQASDVTEWQPRFNLAPTQPAPLITNEPTRRLTMAQFGLVPHWTEGQRGHKLINARSEGVARSRTFGRVLRQRRGIVPVTGYLEWTSLHGKRLPQYIHRADGKALALASLWERWRGDDGRWVQSFAVLTRPAVGALQAVHARMPLALEDADLATWLTPAEMSAQALAEVLGREPDVAPWLHTPVSQLANSPRNDSPDCLALRDEHASPAQSPSRQLQLFDTIEAETHLKGGTR